MAALVQHLYERGDGDEHGQLLRYADGTPITRRRYDYLWNRLGAELSWARALG